MPRVATKSVETATPPQIHVTTITKSVEPQPAAPPPANPPTSRQPWSDFGPWFLQMSEEERLNNFGYYIYRKNDDVVVTNQDLEGRGRGKMLYKFLPEEIAQFAPGNFFQDLQIYVKEHFGGSVYEFDMPNKKTGCGPRIRFAIEGEPILTAREGYVDGRAPQFRNPQMSNSDSGSVLPLVIKMIEDKLSAVNQHREDPAASVAAITNTIMESNSKTFQWLLANMPKPEDPVKQLEMMKGMVEVVKAMQPPVAAASTTTTQPNPMDQISQMATVIKAIRDLDTPKPEGGNIQDIVKTAVTTALQSARPRGGGGTDWGAFLGQALTSPALGSFLIAGAQWLRSKVVAPGAIPQAPMVIQRGGKPAFVRPVAPPAQPATRMQPRPMQEQPLETPEAAQTDAATAPPGAPAEQVVITQEMAQAVLFEYVAHQIVDLFKHDNPGDEVAGSIDRMFPELAVQMRFMNEEMLKGFISANPTLAEIKDDPRLPEFLKDFVGYFKQVDEPEAVTA